MPDDTQRATERVVLEQNQALSRSLLWRIQRAFFEQHGVEAWRQGIVPQYVTSNPYIANAYARVVFGFLRDWFAPPAADPAGRPPDRSQPVYIIELGAGSGRFAYHFLKQFSGFSGQPALKNVSIRYVMTDVAQRTVDYWCNHPSLLPFVAAGQLDMARFDAERPGDLRLIHSGTVLAPGAVINPPIVIANYVFDGIPQDSFDIHEGRLYENLITLTSTQPEPDLGAPDLIGRVAMSYERRIAPDAYYEEPDFNQILRAYQERLAHTTITFPCAALRCLHYCAQLADGRFMLLSADKGYHREAALLHQGDPALSLHGSFSMMVNYHAIAQYAGLRGGETFQTSHQHTSVCIAAFVFGRPPEGYAETRLAFKEAMEKGGPDDFFALKKVIERHYAAFELDALLAYLRLSGWDANIVLDSFPTLLAQAETAAPPHRQELHRAIQQVWEMYYPLNEASDLPFHLGMLLQTMAFYPEALEFYQHSLQMWGPDPSTFHNMGMCQYGLRRLDAALAAIEEALDLDPGFEAAKAMRLQLWAEITDQAL